MDLMYLNRFTLRHAKRSPTTTIALVAIIALGVAVLYSVRLANRAAVSGFQLFTQSLSGGGDLIISTPLRKNTHHNATSITSHSWNATRGYATRSGSHRRPSRNRAR